MDKIEDYKLPVCTGYGVKNPKYMFVGISGGRLGCIQTGIPFTRDMSGKLFQRAMKELGYCTTPEDSEKPEYLDIYVTNLVKGKILDSRGFNRAPKSHEILYWLPDFKMEIARIQPTKLIAVGSLVYEYLTQYIFGKPILKIKHPSWYGRMGASRSDNYAWKEMISEYETVLGKND